MCWMRWRGSGKLWWGTTAAKTSRASVSRETSSPNTCRYRWAESRTRFDSLPLLSLSHNHIHAHTHTHTHTHTHAHTHTFTHSYIHTYTHAHAHIVYTCNAQANSLSLHAQVQTHTYTVPPTPLSLSLSLLINSHTHTLIQLVFPLCSRVTGGTSAQGTRWCSQTSLHWPWQVTGTGVHWAR